MATYTNNNAHPLPAAPVGGASMLPPAPVQHARHHQQSQQPPLQAPRRESQASRPKSRSFSFRSDRSQKSAAPASQKLEPETHDEKEAKRLHTKADPTMAMFEAEPCRSTLVLPARCRCPQYRDASFRARLIQFPVFSLIFASYLSTSLPPT